MLKNVPVFYVLIGYIIGILFHHHKLGFSVTTCVYSCLVLFVLSFFLLRLPTHQKYKLFMLPTLLVIISCAILGYTLSELNDRGAILTQTQIITDDDCTVQVRVIEAPIQKKKSYKITVSILHVIKNNILYNSEGKAFVYFVHTLNTPSIKTGDVLLIKKPFQRILSNRNPGEFDYAFYCRTHGILAQTFINPSEWLKIDSTSWHPQRFIAQIQFYLFSILEKNIQDKNALGFAKALLIGYRNDIDTETWQDYSKTGIVHIIAISGMHIGIIYQQFLILLLLFRFFKRNKTLAIIIAIIFVWLFAALTGFPASVVRSAVMFSILAIADIFQKRKLSMNLLFVCALFMLLYDTNILFDIGFQLSFAAVLGLIAYNGVFANFLFHSNIILYKIGQLIASSLAAQIFTFPLCLYYFHQFPILFLLSNLIAIPLTILILWSEIILLFVSFIQPLASGLGYIIQKLILFTNSIIHQLASFKWAAVDAVYICPTQLFLLFLLLLWISYYILLHKRKYIIVITFTLVLFLLCSTYIHYQKLSDRQLVVYNIQKETCIDLIEGDCFFSIQNDSLSANAYRFALQPARLYLGAKNENSNLATVRDSNYLIASLHDNTILIIRKPIIFHQAIPVDYIILTNDVALNLYDLKQKLSPKVIIADASNKLWKISQWEKQCTDLNLPFYNTPKQGAYIINF